MAQEISYDIPLHDIKPIMDVEEFSLYYLLGISVLVLALLLAIFYLLFSALKKRNRYSRRKEDFKSLNELDFNLTKESAYAVTLYGATFKNDSQRHLEMYENIVARLENYKYKREVAGFDDETLGYIELYKGMIDV